MNTSFVLTSKQRLAGSSYLIPNQLPVKAIRLKSAIIDLKTFNVQNHVFFLGSNLATGDNQHVPPIDAFDYPIPDGHYTPQQYASAVNQVLNQATYRALVEDSQLSTTSEDLLSENPCAWNVTFNESTGKLQFEMHLDGKFNMNCFLSGNEEACDFSGLTFGQHLEWPRRGPETNFPIKTAPNPMQLLPKYYRISCPQLSQFGFVWGDSGSNNLGVIPVDYSRKWTSWTTEDDHFSIRGKNEVELGGMMDVDIYYEDNLAPIHEPEFVLVFQIKV